MSGKISLASKYRPKEFNDIVEQDTVKSILSNQIKTNNLKHAYLFCGSAGTGKTTTCRIIANEMNGGVGTPLELDCASHNGVDDMRLIIEECKTRPIVGKYKIFVLDECFVPETEILTDSGYKQFKDLDHTERIAQYNDDGSIEFVKPLRWIKQHYEGNLECWQPEENHFIRMTPNHQQPLIYNDSNEIRSKSICDIEFTQDNNLILSGKSIGSKSELSDLDKLVIICHLNGSFIAEEDNYNKWKVMFEKTTDVNKFLNIIKKCDISYKKLSDEQDVFILDMPKIVTNKLNTYFSLDINCDYARSFINEIKNCRNYDIEKGICYLSEIKENTSFVSAIATLGGYSAIQNECFKDGVSVINYELRLEDRCNKTCYGLQKLRTVDFYNGDVYCVEVPSHKIIVRATGYTFISGNCHMLTVQAWNSLLKILEEPPEYVIFLFATTDPQKIIGTIMSRVQRFNFHRISIDGITSRLKYIIENENKNNSGVNLFDMASDAKIIKYEEAAINYIARLAKGGMRDSITTLEKCLDYSKDLTLENVLKVTSGGVTEDTIMQFVNYILNGNTKETLVLFNDIYMQGTDVSIFLKLLIEYLQNCMKFLITKMPEMTTLSNNSFEWLLNLESFNQKFEYLLESAIQIKSSYNVDDLKILMESWIIKVCLL